MNKTKQFIKDHQKTIMAIGGTVLVAVIARRIIKTEIFKTFDNAIVAAEALPESAKGYDIWAMVGTDCKQEMLDKMTDVVNEYGKTIMIELL